MINKKLGYYTCNGIEFDSKVKACLYSVQVGQPVEWHFNEETFKKYNWAKEPEETLDQLYDKRSRELRDQYDYLILSYSGGADSHNILMSFIRQNLHIDEILINTNDKASKPFTELNHNNKSSINAAAEYHLQTLPRLKEVEHLLDKTKITVLDLSDYLFESLLKVNDGSWVLEKREGLNPAGMTRFNYIYFDDVRKKFDKEKRIGLVVGIDKPRTMIHNDRFYMRFNDRTTNMITVAEHIKDYTNSVVEFFYWSPDSIRILIKQGHVIKKWLEAFPEYQQYWDSKTLTNKTIRLVHERLLRNILYTTWNDNWYQADKATSDWYSEFDLWFIDGYAGTKANEIWKEGIDWVRNNLKEYTKQNENGVDDGLKVFSVNYPIGIMKRKE